MICAACDCSASGEHLNGKRHLKKVKLLIEEGITYCWACNILVQSHNWDSHTNGRRHRENANEESSEDEDSWICRACDREMHLNSQMSHLGGQAHRQRILNLQSEGRMYCTACNILVQSHNWNSHTNGRRHRENADEESSDDEDSWICTACDREMHLNSQMSHLGGQAHRQRILNLQSEGRMYCIACNILVQTKNWTQHANGRQHRENASVDEDLWYCTACEREMHVNSQTSHLNGQSHLQCVRKLQSDGKTYCRERNIVLQKSHRKGRQHFENTRGSGDCSHGERKQKEKPSIREHVPGRSEASSEASASKGPEKQNEGLSPENHVLKKLWCLESSDEETSSPIFGEKKASSMVISVERRIEEDVDEQHLKSSKEKHMVDQTENEQLESAKKGDIVEKVTSATADIMAFCARVAVEALY